MGKEEDRTLLLQGLGVKGVPIFKDASQRSSIIQSGLKSPSCPSERHQGREGHPLFCFHHLKTKTSLGLSLPSYREVCTHSCARNSVRRGSVPRSAGIVVLWSRRAIWGRTLSPLVLRCNHSILSLKYRSSDASHAKWNHCHKRCLQVFSTREGHLTRRVLRSSSLTLEVRLRKSSGSNRKRWEQQPLCM